MNVVMRNKKILAFIVASISVGAGFVMIHFVRGEVAINNLKALCITASSVSQSCLR